MATACAESASENPAESHRAIFRVQFTFPGVGFVSLKR